MAKKTNKNNRAVRAQRKEVEQKVDQSSRVLQFLALLIAGILLVTDALVQTYELPVWIIGGIIGIAVGFSPDQFYKLIKEAIMAFIGKKK